MLIVDSKEGGEILIRKYGWGKNDRAGKLWGFEFWNITDKKKVWKPVLEAG